MGLYSRELIIGKIFASEIFFFLGGGAGGRGEGLFSGELIFGGALILSEFYGTPLQE